MTTKEAIVIALCVTFVLLNAGWRLSQWYGFIPCSHACYWCGKSLEPCRKGP